MIQHLCKATAELAGHHPLRWFIEEIRNTGGEVGEQTNGVAEKLRASDDMVQLPKKPNA